MAFRQERDSMGTVEVPADAYYGSQTQRAADNFFDSGLKLPAAFIHHLAHLKQCAAKANMDLGLLAPQAGQAIVQAAGQVMAGELDDQFVVDLFQTGSGTSTNMNMNEVIASRANEIVTGRRGGRSPVHPNDHVNMGQSSNDVIPTVIHVSAAHAIRSELAPALDRLQRALAQKADDFADIRKIGRTHLQDAVPMFLGDEFRAYARQVQLAADRVQSVMPRLSELALGGTAVGSGLNTHPEFAARVIDQFRQYCGIDFVEAGDHFEAQAARDAAVETSGMLKTIAVSIVKIANDIRWMGSGPRCGIGEIQLPAVQPGSSIMPGKVNPVIAESVIQAAFQVMGNDTAITLGGQSGVLELNVCLPLLAHNLLLSIRLLSGAARMLAEKCVDGLAADRERCEGNIENSLALVTALVPHIGYDRAADIAKKAHASGRTVRQVAIEQQVLPAEQINRLLG